MNISLGIHVGHDRGACIIKDGEVIAAIANERLDRIKHSNSTEIPFQSIDTLLENCNLTINDISVIGLSAVAIENNNVYNFYKNAFFSHYSVNIYHFILSTTMRLTHILAIILLVSIKHLYLFLTVVEIFLITCKKRKQFIMQIKN